MKLLSHGPQFCLNLNLASAKHFLERGLLCLASLPLLFLAHCFAQGSPYQIVSQFDPRSGTDLTTPLSGALNQPQVATAPLSPLPVDIEPNVFEGSLSLGMRLATPLAKGASLPDLVLAYNSQASFGPVGVGWTLSAGSIVRNRAHGIDYTSKDFLISLGSASVELLNLKGDLYRDK
jgi:hypothetical protein